MVSSGSVSVVCPANGNEERFSCHEVARADLAPEPGDEVIYGCNGSMHCDATPPRFEAVVVLTAAGPLAAIATTNDMSCGHEVSLSRDGTRHVLRLRGGGEDGSYDARYGWRRRRFERLSMRYRASRP